MVDPALNVLLKSMKGKQGQIALAAARDVLDRNGLKEPDRLISVNINVDNPGEILRAELEALNARLTSGTNSPTAIIPKG